MKLKPRKSASSLSAAACVAGLFLLALCLRHAGPARAQSAPPGASVAPINLLPSGALRAFDQLALTMPRADLSRMAIEHPAELARLLAPLKSREEVVQEERSMQAILHPLTPDQYRAKPRTPQEALAIRKAELQILHPAQFQAEFGGGDAQLNQKP